MARRGPYLQLPKPKKLEHGLGTSYGDFLFSLGFGIGGQSYSNFLASAVGLITRTYNNGGYGSDAMLLGARRPHIEGGFRLMKNRLRAEIK